MSFFALTFILGIASRWANLIDTARLIRYNSCYRDNYVSVA